MLANFAVNKKGHLTWGGADTVELAKEYGTPLYVIDEDMLRQRATDFQKAMKKYFPQGEVIYAGKALFCQALCDIVNELGLSLDVVSGGELYVALKSGYPPEKIYFHGNNKSLDELKMALNNNVGTIVVDNWFELNNLEELAKEMQKKPRIYLRIAPGIEAHTHVHIQTGQEDSKFGFTKDDALLAAKKASLSPNLDLKGLHCHVGSQIVNLESFTITAKVMSEIKAKIEREISKEIEELDLGGGLGIQYLPEDPYISPDEFVKAISLGLTDSNIKLRVEPGRYLIGQAGITLYTIGSKKEIPGLRTYVAVDGGMTDNPRVALYDAKYHAVLANKPQKEKTDLVSIAGKCCESGDMLVWDIMLPHIEPGDILAVFSTGAYNYSMASNYNLLPRPAMIFVRDGIPRMVVRRETYEDLLLRDIK
ncbi:MAG TPA: diaminopimelate decarboxylase [Firmicutes bacterium]|nr:diaminopimelate decarboxylase [Bacillota bacterium]